MNEKEKPKSGKKPEPLKSKGFYAALYSCVGVMLVLAVIIGYNNFGKNNGSILNLPEDTPEIVAGLEPETNWEFKQEGVQVSQSGDEALQGLSESEELNNTADEIPSALENENPGGGSSEVANLSKENSDGGDDGQITDPPDGYVSSHDSDGYALGNAEELPDSETGSIEEDDPEVLSGLTVPEPEQPEEENIRSFNEETERMAWPITGDVVMNYSADHLLYDRTLEQYRTNNNICIGAPEGTPVRAAAGGIVTDIFGTRESGRTVVVEHGNGWTTTYSQLQDSVLVRTGNVVAQGQQIGGVGMPTMFSSQLGTHLAFTVYKDNITVDPNRVLN